MLEYPLLQFFRTSLRQGSRLRMTWPRGYKFFSMLNAAGHEIFLLINVKMPTIVGILTFMNRKNSIQGLSEPVKSLISSYLYT